MWVSRVEDADKVKDTVQVNNPLKLQNNAGGLRSPLKANFRAVQKLNQAQGATNEAGVLVTLSGGAKRGNISQNVMSLSNLDVNLFAAD